MCYEVMLVMLYNVVFVLSKYIFNGVLEVEFFKVIVIGVKVLNI